MIAAAITVSVIKSYGQQVELDKFERKILKEDSAILAKTFELNEKLRREVDSRKVDLYRSQLHEYCGELKYNVDKLIAYEDKKRNMIGAQHHFIIERLKSIGLDLGK